MGVSIRGYGDIGFVRNRPDQEEDPTGELTDLLYDQYASVWSNPSFPGRNALIEGFYSYGQSTQSVDTSYGGYNRHREIICRHFLGVEPKEVWLDLKSFEHPISDLIHFSDCEGAISNPSAARIYSALKEYVSDENDDDMLRYHASFVDGLTEAFRVAAEHDGFVRFS